MCEVAYHSHDIIMNKFFLAESGYLLIVDKWIPFTRAFRLFTVELDPVALLRFVAPYCEHIANAHKIS